MESRFRESTNAHSGINSYPTPSSQTKKLLVVSSKPPLKSKRFNFHFSEDINYSFRNHMHHVPGASRNSGLLYGRYPLSDSTESSCRPIGGLALVLLTLNPQVSPKSNVKKGNLPQRLRNLTRYRLIPIPIRRRCRRTQRSHPRAHRHRPPRQRTIRPCRTRRSWTPTKIQTRNHPLPCLIERWASRSIAFCFCCRSIVWTSLRF